MSVGLHKATTTTQNARAKGNNTAAAML